MSVKKHALATNFELCVHVSYYNYYPYINLNYSYNDLTLQLEKGFLALPSLKQNFQNHYLE